jgi:hypothetical protein
MTDHITQIVDASGRHDIECSICREGLNTPDSPMGRALMHQFKIQHKHTRGKK